MAFLSESVRHSRRDAMDSLMDEHGLDALMFLTPDYFFFASNFHLDVAPWERPVAVVVTRSGESFALMHELSTNHVAMARKRGSLWVDDVTLYSEHPRISGRLPLTPQWPQVMAGLLRRHGLARARIGVDARTMPLTLTQAYLPELSVHAIEPSMRTLRLVKHEEELNLIRKAAALSDWGQARFREQVRPGRMVQELDFSVAAMIAEEAGRRHSHENVEIRLHSLTGPDASAPHGTGAESGVAFEAGHGIVNVLIIRYNGFVVENERTWFVGTPSDVQAKAFEAACAAQAAAVARLVTDGSLADVDAAALAVFESRGYGANVVHRTGHGIGIAGHEFPDDMAFNMRPLMAREVYSAEPGIYLPGVGGFRHDDTVIVGSEPEVVTKAPKDLESQMIPV